MLPYAPQSSPDSSGKPGEAIVRRLCAGLEAQPNKKQLSIAFVKVASEAQRATQGGKEAEWLLLLIALQLLLFSRLFIGYLTTTIIEY